MDGTLPWRKHNCKTSVTFVLRCHLFSCALGSVCMYAPSPTPQTPHPPPFMSNSVSVQIGRTARTRECVCLRVCVSTQRGHVGTCAELDCVTTVKAAWKPREAVFTRTNTTTYWCQPSPNILIPGDVAAPPQLPLPVCIYGCALQW